MFYKNISNKTIYIKDKKREIIIHPNQIVKLDKIQNRYKEVLIQQIPKKIEQNITPVILQKNAPKSSFNDINKQTYTINQQSVKISENNVKQNNIKQDNSLQDNISTENPLIDHFLQDSLLENSSLLNKLLQQILDVLKSGSFTQPVYVSKEYVSKEKNDFENNFNENFEEVNNFDEVKFDEENFEEQPEVNLEDLDPILANLLSNAER